MPTEQQPPHSRFWPENLPRNITFPEGNAFLNLERSALRFPQRPAVYFYGATLTYADLLQQVIALAGYLQHACGVRRGDRVLLDMQNCPHFIVAFYAILRADAVAIPVNPMNVAHELDHLAEDSGARVAIVGSELAERFAGLVDTAIDRVITANYADALPPTPLGRLPDVLLRKEQTPPDGPFVDFRAAVSAGLTPGELTTGSDDVAIMPYTSGTTGKPKACIHHHSTLSFITAACATWYELDENSVIGCSMPMFHITGLQVCMGAGLFAGAALMIMTRWDRDAVPLLFSTYKVSWWSAAPTMIIDVLNSDNYADDTFASLRVLTGGGAPMPAAVSERLRAQFNLLYCEGYGLTEAASATHINPLSAPKPQSLGIPIFNTDAIIADPDTLRILPPGEVGEILISGPQVMVGYWKRPEATAEVLVTIDGRTYLRSGDLGRMDGDGYFYAVDRLKRMINVSGYKVWPAECEQVLHGHPAVSECSVISAPDAYRGETVKALIVLRQDYRSITSEDDIITFARQNMAAYKVPRYVEFAKELPRSAAGKIDWRRLQEAEWLKEPAAAGSAT